MYEPAVVSRNPGTLNVYVTNMSDGISSRDWNGGPNWTEWHNLSADEMQTNDGHLLKVTSGPAAVSDAPGHVTLFVRGGAAADGRELWTKWYNDREGWSRWHSLGGDCTSAPSVCTRQGQLHVFVRNLSGGLSVKTWAESANWSPWMNLPNKRKEVNLDIAWTDRPAVTCPTQDAISVYVLDAEGGILWLRWWTEGQYALDKDRPDIPSNEKGWQGWELQDPNDESPQVSSSPAAVGDFLFAAGLSRDLRWRHFIGGPPDPWTFWESLGGKITTGPAAASKAEGQFDVFARGADGALWTKWFSDGRWSEWGSLGGVLKV